MKYLLALLFGLVLAAAVLVIGSGMLLLDSAPVVRDAPPLTPADLAAVRSLLQQATLRDQESGKLQQLSLRSREIEQAMNYLLDARLNGNASVNIDGGVAALSVSVPVPPNPFGRWLNLEVAMEEAGDFLQVQRLHIGSLTVPASIANRLMLRVHEELLSSEPKYAELAAAVSGFSIGTDQLTISYRWQRALMDHLAAGGRSLMLDPVHQERLSAHAAQLVQAVATMPDKTSITALLNSMFRFAQQRGGSAVEENRAALQLLAMYVIDVDPTRLLGAIPGVSPMRRNELRLSGRHDFAQHLLVSAGLAVSSDDSMAAEVGLLKEQLDTRAGGSGFSFNDLAVDHAGARLGELAVSNESNAKQVQRVLAAAALQETTFTPLLQDLPEFMSETEFARRFVAVGSPEYNTMVDTIEGRIRQLPLFVDVQ